MKTDPDGNPGNRGNKSPDDIQHGCEEPFADLAGIACSERRQLAGVLARQR